jgi:hypothetical protein
VVLLHKIDPESSSDPTLCKNVESFKESISPEMETFKFYYFETSVYSLQAVIRAFSFAVRILYTETQAVQQFLMDLSMKFKNTLALLLFEENGISIGEMYQDHLTLQIKKKILTLFEVAQRRIIARNINFYEFSDRMDAFLKISGVIQTLEVYGLTFFIMLVLEEKDEESIIIELDSFESQRNDLTFILKNLVGDTPEKQKELGNV